MSARPTTTRRTAGQLALELPLELPGIGLPPEWKAQQRLHSRKRKRSSRKGRQKAVIAVARELTGCIWALAQAHTAHTTTAAAPTTEIAA